MTPKVFLFAVLCFGLLINQIKTQCLIRTSSYSAIEPKFFRDYESATSLITNETQGIQLKYGEKIIGHCKTRFVNAHSSDSDIKISCESGRPYIRDSYGSYYPSSPNFDCKPENVVGTCSIAFPPDRNIRPTLFKKIGSRTVQVIPQTSTTIAYDQELIAKCDTNFKSPSYHSGELNLICLNGKIVALGFPHATNHDYLECKSLKWYLYDSSKPFPWCPSPMVSYILARPSAQFAVYEYLAGICYDLKQMSLKSLYYAAKHNFEKYSSPKFLESFVPLMQISDIDENFVSTSSYLYENAQAQKWFSFAKYEKESIIQNLRVFVKNFQPFNQLLNIDWWPGLQTGNWQRYEEALAKGVEYENNEYDILAGVSNAVAVPIYKENCSKNLTMIDLVDTGSNKLPLYVWNYLKSSRNSSNDVLVIGVNTPFTDFYDEKELIFCEDICHKIDWLDNTRLTFRYRPLGIIFCCSVDDVATSGRLDEFGVPAEPITPTSLPLLNFKYFSGDETTTTEADTGYDETTEREQEYDEYGNLY